MPGNDHGARGKRSSVHVHRPKPGILVNTPHGARRTSWVGRSANRGVERSGAGAQDDVGGVPLLQLRVPVPRLVGCDAPDGRAGGQQGGDLLPRAAVDPGRVQQAQLVELGSDAGVDGRGQGGLDVLAGDRGGSVSGAAVAGFLIQG